MASGDRKTHRSFAHPGMVRVHAGLGYRGRHLLDAGVLMSRRWGKSIGPWAHWGKLDSIWEIGGWPLAARLTIDEHVGIFFSVASPLFGSVVLGVVPDHKVAGCVTVLEPHHYCWASKLPQIALGPEPRDLREAGMRRKARLEQIELALLQAAV